MLYVLKAAITLALLYSCFFLFLSKETFHRFNRIMLVGIMIVSLVMPLFHFTTSHPTALNEEVYLVQTYIEEDTTPIIVTAQHTQSFTWMQALTWLYLAGVAIMLILTLVQAFSLIRFMRGGVRHTDSQGNTVILHNSDVPPFSIFRYIVMSVKDYEISRPYILTHEQEHIRLGHTYDLLLLQCVKTLQWFNPFIWFLSRDLKAVHEYEADQAVINQGIDAKSYQQLLVIKVVGDRLQPFTNNLNHGSLKKRIVMMYQKPSNRWLMLKALCAIPVAALTINTFATPIETDPMEDMVKTLETKAVPTFNKSETPAAIVTEEAPAPVVTEQTLQDDDEPLIVINGHEVKIPTDIKTIDNASIAKLLNLNEDDIESITVLKDGAATAIYGDKGKNGVIEIKLKEANQISFETIIDRLPGAEKHEDGSITINGRTVQKITIEGQEVYNANEEPDEVFEVCEDLAKYPGGQGAMMEFFVRNLRYPKEAHKNGIQTRVILQFIVEKDGSLSNFKVLENKPTGANGSTLDDMITVTAAKIKDGIEVDATPEELLACKKLLENEAIRVVKLMPKWEPAKQRGHVVRMRYTIPVTFRLQ